MVRLNLLIIILLSGVGGCRPSVTCPSPLAKATQAWRVGNLAVATALCDEALRAEPGNFEALLLRAQIRERRGLRDQALRDVSRALAGKPEDRAAQALLQDIHDARRTPEEPKRFGPPKVQSVQSIQFETLSSDDYYPSRPSPRQSRYARESPPAGVMPRQTAFGRLQQAIEADRQNRSAQEQSAAYEAMRQRLEEHDEPFQEMPASPVARFDLGSMGLGQHVEVPVATTGHARRFDNVSEPLLPRRRQLSGQCIPPGQQESLVSAAFFHLIEWHPLESMGARDAIRSCIDGLDNDGNGVTDIHDPSCWGDRMSPSSFSPDLQEAGGLPASGFSAAGPSPSPTMLPAIGWHVPAGAPAIAAP